MGTEGLRAEIVALGAADLSVDPAGLGPEIGELIVLSHALQAQISRRLEAYDQVRGYGDEFLTLGAWLRAQTTMSSGDAAAQLRVARLRAKLPKLIAVWEAGQTTFRHLDAVQAGLRLLPEALWADVDEHLATAARTMTAHQLAVFLADLAQQLAPSPKPKDETQHEARRLSLTQGFDGMTVLTGRLTPEVGEKMQAALSALSRPDIEDESRLPNQRTADALSRLLDLQLAGGQLPVDGGEKPHITLTVDLDQIDEAAQAVSDSDPAAGSPAGPFGRAFALQQLPLDERAATVAAAADAARAVAEATSGRPRFAWTGPSSVRAARRLCCDGVVLPILTRGGEPIDVGRRTRVVSTALRALLVARDRHCRWPGCEQTPRWCEGHHLVHWADGGPTDAWNLALLCDAHHAAAHSGRWIVTADAPGRLRVRPRLRSSEPYYEIGFTPPGRTGPPGRTVTGATAPSA